MPEEVTECAECHVDIANHWEDSPHAHAYDDPFFQEQWQALGQPGDCLVCHTTSYEPATGDFVDEGVSCESCHGVAKSNHPPETMPILADAEYCGTCHTTTIKEWNQSDHAPADVGCMDCHDPHSQERLFKVSDDLCINCHQDDMGDYLNDTHVQNNIGCVDCHALVIPPDPIPDDGIVPTGHTFTITPATCVACHTDSLHAGFSLPGFDASAETADETGTLLSQAEEELTDEIPTEQRVEALEAALAGRTLATLFQGGIIGLVLGGTTAWIVARNVRRLPED
ncbi:MAG: hypothetical protein GWO08_23065 [Gammaproteobacteria bacterium]|nr:hypothetical protein [Gammaproteobacteria bacterium]